MERSYTEMEFHENFLGTSVQASRTTRHFAILSIPRKAAPISVCDTDRTTFRSLVDLRKPEASLEKENRSREQQKTSVRCRRRFPMLSLRLVKVRNPRLRIGVCPKIEKDIRSMIQAREIVAGRWVRENTL